MNDRLVTLLEQTSRTFLIPIMQAPPALRDTIGAAYLCMRAIDEIEDHPDLASATKSGLLREVAVCLRRSSAEAVKRGELDELLKVHAGVLPDVSLELADIAEAVPREMRDHVFDATASMAEEMADWVEADFQINNEADLDAYTFTVAGRVGLLLSYVWKHYDGTVTNEEESIGFGRALQAVNIVRNHDEDGERGVDFFPPGWDSARMIAYARRQIEMANRYMEKLDQDGPVHAFCEIPLVLAVATLDAIENGEEKLTREEVIALLASLQSE